MGIPQTDNQRLDTVRTIYSQTHERNKELATYIRLTNAGIWGFLGIAFIEFFKDCPPCLINIPLFLILTIISMIVWRWIVKKFQDDIVDGYIRILRCEVELEIEEKFSIKKGLIRKIPSFIKRAYELDEYNDLCQYLEDKKYEDPEHKKLDIIAYSIVTIAFTLLLTWLLAFIFYCFHSQLCII